MTNRKELIIDIKDLFSHVMKRWVYFVVAVIVFSAIVGGYKTISITRSQNNVYSEEKREALTEKLTDAEVNEIENLFNRYLAYKNRIAYSESYLEKSVLMRLDPGKLPTLTVQYSVVTDQQNMLSSFTSMSLGVSEYERIASVLGDNTDPSSISELVSISNSSTDKDSLSIDVDSQNSVYIGSVNNIYKCMMNLTAHASSQNQCEQIMAIMEQAIETKYQSLLDAGISVSLTRIGEKYTENSASWLADRQRTMISETSTLKTEYDSFEKNELSSFTNEEKDYFAFLKNAYEGKKEIQSKKFYFLLGGVIGFLLTFIIVLARYFLGSRISNKWDYISITGNNDVMDTIYNPKRHKLFFVRPIDRMLNKICFDVGSDYDTKEKAIILAKRIRHRCKQENINEFFIVDDSTRQNAKELLSIITDTVSHDGITVHVGNPLSSSDDYDLFESSKAVLYFGNICDSKKDSLQSYSKLFGENKPILLGSILHQEL